MIKSITGTVKFHGIGAINNETPQQRFILLEKGFLKGRAEKNTVFHKKEFFSEDGKDYFRYKVSRDCIRHAMFQETMPFFNASLAMLPQVLFNAVTKPEMIVRGYMFADGNLPTTFKKKSAITISDAVSTDKMDNVQLEIKSRAGYKGAGEDTVSIDDDGNERNEHKSSNSLFFTESVGEHDYTAKMFINLSELQFFPMDELYSRPAAIYTTVAEREHFMKSLKRNFGVTEDIKQQAYYIKDAVMGEESAEEGILFTPEMVDKMVHVVLNNIINTHIERPACGGIFEFVEMELSLNYSDGTTKNITVKNVSDIDNIFFGYEQVYFPADEERIAKRDKLFTELKSKKKKK